MTFAFSAEIKSKRHITIMRCDMVAITDGSMFVATRYMRIFSFYSNMQRSLHSAHPRVWYGYQMKEIRDRVENLT
jgi:hypothetical protein